MSPTYGSGTSQVIASVRAKGDQSPIVRVIDQVGGTATSEIVIHFGQILIYFRDYAALESLTDVLRRAGEVASKVFPEARMPRRT